MPDNTPATAAWTKKPEGDGFYWHRPIDARGHHYAEPLHVFKGQIYTCSTQLDEIVGCEFLGPITPEDFERFAKLRAACEAARKLLVGIEVELDNANDVKAMIQRLREALNQ